VTVDPELTVADPGTGPRITVTFPDVTVGAYELVVDADGATVSEKF